MTFEEFLERKWAPLRNCSICGDSIGIEPHPVSAAIMFNSNCSCVSFTTEPVIAEWSQVRQALQVGQDNA